MNLNNVANYFAMCGMRIDSTYGPSLMSRGTASDWTAKSVSYRRGANDFYEAELTGGYATGVTIEEAVANLAAGTVDQAKRLALSYANRAAALSNFAHELESRLDQP